MIFAMFEFLHTTEMCYSGRCPFPHLKVWPMRLQLTSCCTCSSFTCERRQEVAVFHVQVLVMGVCGVHSQCNVTETYETTMSANLVQLHNYYAL